MYSSCNRKILYLYQPNQLPSSKFYITLESLVPIFKATFWRRSLLPYLKSRLSLQSPTNIGWHLSAIGSGLSNIIWIYLASSRYKVQAFKVQEHAPHLWDSNAAVSICIPLSYLFLWQNHCILWQVGFVPMFSICSLFSGTSAMLSTLLLAGHSPLHWHLPWRNKPAINVYRKSQ